MGRPSEATPKIVCEDAYAIVITSNDRREFLHRLPSEHRDGHSHVALLHTRNNAVDYARSRGRYNVGDYEVVPVKLIEQSEPHPNRTPTPEQGLQGSVRLCYRRP